jgi:PelA/Pel-15E family pectate lyase
LRIADIILSFQTPAGGWSKNLDMSSHRRAPGEHFAPGNASRYLGHGDFDEPLNENWHYVGTFDNDATTTQLRYLTKVIAALKSSAVQPYRKAFLHGLDYVFAAQYPNGGWPQVWPLEGGYHDAITFNDDAMINVLRLLRDVAEGKEDFAFVPAIARKLAAASVRRGIECILAAQIVVQAEKTDAARAGEELGIGRIGQSGRMERRTVWCQQHDPLTLAPASARNYEMPSLVSAESAQIALFLMELPNPDRETAAAIRAAAAWFDKTKIYDVAFGFTAGEGRRLVSAPGNGPLWSRYYEIGSDRPIFGDRDKTIHDTVEEISQERRNGYGWFRDTPQRALERYAAWEKEHP